MFLTQIQKLCDIAIDSSRIHCIDEYEVFKKLIEVQDYSPIGCWTV